MSDGDWIPDLVYLEDFGGDWQAYLEGVHQVFLNDFVRSKPTWPGKRVSLKRHPEYDGKSATFWHFISEGSREEERTPEFRRCERIGWPRPIIDRYPDRKPGGDDPIRWWKSQRRNEERFILSLPDFSYIVVIADRGDYVLPWTAFAVEQSHRQQKLSREFESYWASQP